VALRVLLLALLPAAQAESPTRISKAVALRAILLLVI
jgi:hypothetical protein